jgi:hypothetical protein
VLLRLCVGVVGSLLVVAPAQGQSTRAEELERQRSAKAADLEEHRPGRIGRLTGARARRRLVARRRRAGAVTATPAPLRA